MLRENNISVKDSFNIWFNREKKKEFYTIDNHVPKKQEK